MNDFVIVIGRQFGSGGRSIGKMIAQRLEIDFYDSRLLKEAAKSLGVSTRIFQDHDEKKPSVFKALLQGAYGIPDNFHSVPLCGERIYDVQCRVIKDLYKRGPCVIVGRNADFLLKDFKGLLSIFLHAPLEARVKRILERGEASNENEAIELARLHDKRRESYYNYYTGDRKWGVADNYHLSFDTSVLPPETITDIIIEIINKRQK